MNGNGDDRNGTARRAEEEREEGPASGRLLIFAASESDSDLYWKTRFLVPDPMVWLDLGGETVLLVKDLEYGRALSEARVDRVVSTSSYEDTLRSRDEAPRWHRIIDLFLRDAGLGPESAGARDAPEPLTVPASFPLYPADRLRELGYVIEACADPFFPERPVKTPEEVAAIQESQQAAEECMELVIGEIARAEVRGGTLHARGAPLTSEGLRAEALKLLLERGYLGLEMIIAGGDQGCDPHQRGSGPLRAGETIIIDIFPRSLTTRYWGDITRTVVRGKASDPVRKLYQDVLAAQEQALGLLRDGVDGRDVHQAVVDLFHAQGNLEEERDGKKAGFIHGTGHGVGLDIHEPPSLGKTESRVEAGHAVTVEPGLYYPGVGAVRIEDLVVVTEDGYRNLTSFPKVLEV